MHKQTLTPAASDAQAANAIDAEVAQNQTRIQQLTQLLDGANVSAQLKATLQEQIQTLQQEQEQLQQYAQKERGAWGLFSWRF